MEVENQIWSEALAASRTYGEVTKSQVKIAVGIEDTESIQKVLDAMVEMGWLLEYDGTYHPTTPETARQS